MIKRILMVLAVVLAVGVLIIGALGWWAYRKMTGPIYEPGHLAGTSAIRLPVQARDGGLWAVEPGVDLHHFAQGSGPPILFVHGGPGIPTRAPMPWLESLSRSHKIHFYDQRGCGASTRPFDRFPSANFYANMTQLESTLGLGAQIMDIERIRMILGADQLTLIGHSFGGFLASLYAAEFPERVGKLILLAPADMLVMPSERQDLFSLVREQLPADQRVEYDQFLETYLDFGGLFTRDELQLAEMHARMGDYILRAMGRFVNPPDPSTVAEAGGWMVNAMYFSMGRRHDYREAMRSITADTLVVHGDGDLQSVSASSQYTTHIADAKLMTLAGADHFFDGEHPDLSAKVLAFLDAGSEE